MRTVHLYIDDGSGWHNHTGREQDSAGLTGLTIDWGTDKPWNKPDANVLHFRMRDRTGAFSGRVSELLGSMVMVMLTRTPTWRDLAATADPRQTWAQTDGTWASLHEDYWADPYGQPDERGLILFLGTLTTGGTITNTGREYLLDLYASSITIQLDRDTTTGPLSGGRQWAGTPAETIKAVRQRLTTDNVWDISQTTADRLAGLVPDALGGWKSDQTVTTRQALDQLTNWHPHMIQWYERHTTDGDAMDYWPLASPSRLILHADGHLSVESDGTDQDVQPASSVQVSAAEFTIPDPYRAIEIKGLDGDETTSVVIDAPDLPKGIRDYGETIGLDTTMRLDKWQPDSDAIADARATLDALDTRLTPETITSDQHAINLDDNPSLFTPSPSLWGILQASYADLYRSNGLPAVSGPWIAIGGTITFTWRDHRPNLSNRLTMSPLPLEWDPNATWASLDPITLPWNRMDMTWAELAMMTYQP